MHIRITGIIESDSPLDWDEVARINDELIAWCEANGLYFSGALALEESREVLDENEDKCDGA
jgi:hypothetical protein